MVMQNLIPFSGKYEMQALQTKPDCCEKPPILRSLKQKAGPDLIGIDAQTFLEKIKRSLTSDPHQLESAQIYNHCCF